MMARVIPPPRRRWHRLLNRVSPLWPQWPLAVAIMLCGILNILSGLRQPLVQLFHVKPLLELGNSLKIFGGGAQAVLGTLLVLIGIGLLWRLAVAWSFALLMLTITIVANLIQHNWQASLYLPGLMLVALLVLQHHFTRRAPLANFLYSLISIFVVMAYGTFGSFVFGNGFHPEIHDLVAAFYFTIVTLATVGYGDIVPVTPETRLFVTSFIIIGLGIFATILASVIGPAISVELSRIFSPAEDKVEPKDHIILAGEGSIAQNTARELAVRKIFFIQIISPGSEPLIAGQQVVKGNPSEEKILLEAGAKTARMVIAAREDDGENAFISLVAKDLNPQVRVLALASSAGAISRLKLAQADLVFAPSAVGGRLLVNLVEGSNISPEFQDLLEGKPQKG
jgi:voltage-gated potassium channel